MEPIWVKNYPPGVPAAVDVHELGSLRDLLQRACLRFGELPAYSNMGASLTYAELDRSSRDFAAYLQKSLGLRKGDRVALMMPNLLQYPVALFGVLRAGLVVVNVNPQYTAPELEHQLADSGAVAIVVLENFAHTLQEVLERNPTLKLVVITTEVGDLFPMAKEILTNLVVKYVKHMVPAWKIAGAIELNAALRAGHGQAVEEVPLGHDDTAFLQYTGGTTGVAKGVVLTHGNLVANVQQLAAWMARDLVEGKELFVCPLPLYHVYALTSSLVFMKIGAHTVLVTNPKDMHAFIHDLKKHPFTIIIGVNTLYRALLDAPEFAEVDTRALKLTSAGGMAVQRVVAERWKERTGASIIEGYGLTETSPVVIASPLDIEAWSGTIGMPIPSTQATILDEGGKALAVGEVGEICVRGPQVMKGYWNRPEETRQVFTADGWFRTGDLGPALTEQALLDHCRQHLTGYKVPKIVEFRSEPLPKSNLGKILRRELRDAAATADPASPPLASA